MKNQYYKNFKANMSLASIIILVVGFLLIIFNFYSISWISAVASLYPFQYMICYIVVIILIPLIGYASFVSAGQIEHASLQSLFKRLSSLWRFCLGGLMVVLGLIAIVLFLFSKSLRDNYQQVQANLVGYGAVVNETEKSGYNRYYQYQVDNITYEYHDKTFLLRGALSEMDMQMIIYYHQDNPSKIYQSTLEDSLKLIAFILIVIVLAFLLWELAAFKIIDSSWFSVLIFSAFGIIFLLLPNIGSQYYSFQQFLLSQPWAYITLIPFNLAFLVLAVWFINLFRRRKILN